MEILREFYLKSNETVHCYKMNNGSRIYIFNDQGLYFYGCNTVKSLFDFLKRGKEADIIFDCEKHLDFYLKILDEVPKSIETWTTRDGRILKIKNMTSYHIKKVIGFLSKKKPSILNQNRITIFNNELKKRNGNK